MSSNDTLGLLTLSEDVSSDMDLLPSQCQCHFFQGTAVLNSSGSLENNENLGQIISASLQVLSSAGAGGSKVLDEPLKRLSFLYTDHAYVVIKSGKTIQIAHKKIHEEE